MSTHPRNSNDSWGAGNRRAAGSHRGTISGSTPVKVIAGIWVVLLAFIIYKQLRRSPADQPARTVLDVQADQVRGAVMTSDRAKLAAVKTDVRLLMTAQEEYFSAHTTYAQDLQSLLAAQNIPLSNPGSTEVVGVATGFEAAVTDLSIGAGFNVCFVRVGAGAPPNVDGLIICSGPSPHRFSLSRESIDPAGVPNPGHGSFAAEGICADVAFLGTRGSRSAYGIHVYRCADSTSADGFRYEAVEGERLYWESGDSVARGVLALGGAETTDASKWPRFSIWGEGNDSIQVPRLLAGRTMILMMLPR